MDSVEAYFSSSGDNASKLAARIGRSPSSITRPLNGERNASMTLALQVEAATNGALSAGQFLEACLKARASRLVMASPAPSHPEAAE